MKSIGRPFCNGVVHLSHRHVHLEISLYGYNTDAVKCWLHHNEEVEIIISRLAIQPFI